MPDNKNESKIQHRNLFTRFFLFIINTLVLLGYIIIYPFENIMAILRSFRTQILIISKKPITIDWFKRTYQWVLAHIKVYQQLRDTKKKKKLRLQVKKKKERNIEKAHRQRNRRGLSILKFFSIFTFGMLFSLVFLALPAFGYYWIRELPSPELLEQQTQNSTTKILDRNGKVLYEIFIDKKYDPVPLKKVPDDMLNATLAIEDAGFYSHPGFDMKGILRAAKRTFLEDDIQGGSTITQQLVKNVLLTPEQTFSRKIKELALSVLVERNYTKSQILEYYFNNIPYGGTSYGVQAASQKYFGKNVWDLDLSESSMLAGLPSAPSAYSPFNGNVELAKSRQRQVLSRMVELGYITSSEARIAFDKELTFAPQVEYIRAPHFVNYVRDSLYAKFGQRAVDFGGLTVTTTLDLDLQDKVQQILTEEVEKNGKQLEFSNGAALILDSRNGQILAYVGSVNFFSEDEGNFDVVTAYRQPGSSIKPFTYALALEQGATAITTIDDSPITYQTSGQKYTPRNYDNKYHGKVTIRQALANSYNIPAVKTINSVGVDNFVELGNKLGFDNWVVGDGSYGMSITLGGKEVRLIDLVNAYSTFARQGIYRDVTPFLAVKDIYGYDLIGLVDKKEERVFSSETSYIISHILSDNVARTPAFGPNSQLYLPGKTVAVKTGTTNDIRDNLTVGFTPTYTVGVWVGNNDNSTMNNRLASGLTGAAPIWNKIMQEILRDTEDEMFPVPEDILVKEDSSCVNKVEVFDKNNKIPDTICSKKTNKDKVTENSNSN